MRVRDSRKRTVMDENGEKYIFSLRRFQCNRCKSIHLELPDCIIPNKRYSKDAINMVVSGKWIKAQFIDGHTRSAMTKRYQIDMIRSREVSL